MGNGENLPSEKPSTRWHDIAFEDIVITTAAIIGMIGATIMVMFPDKFPPILPAVFLGMGISSLVYRFLGGISENTSLTIKGVKLAGTAAAWIGCSWLINFELVKQMGMEPGEELHVSVYKENRILRSGLEVIAGQEEKPFDMGPNGTYEIPLENFEKPNFIIVTYTPLAAEEDPNAEQKEVYLQYDAREPAIKVHMN